MINFFRWFARNRRVQVIFILLALSLPLFLIIYGIVIPVKNYKPYSEDGIDGIAPTDTSHTQNTHISGEQLTEVKNIISLENEKAYLQNRLSLAENDSIYLILDLPDSLLVLEIKGVPVRKNKIITQKVSQRFSLINHENLLPWIAAPFTLERDISTIPKMPIVVKQAPKDTVEAAQSSSTPKPPEATAVFFTLYFDRNLVIEIEQADPPQEEDLKEIKDYRSKKRKESNRSVFNTLRDPQQADQPMRISLVVSEADARAIYRAIPTKTHLILKL